MSCDCPRSNHRHGTNRNYVVHHCRCFACRVAHANAQHAYRHGQSWRENDHAPSIGVRRRLQALAAIGWSANDLAPLLGMSADYVAKIRADERHALIRRCTFDAVARVYDQLWDRPRTDSDGHRTSTQARGLGYVIPLAWDDDELDDPDARPHTPADGRLLAECGTTAAYRRHLRRGEKPCLDCAGAEARRVSDQRKKAA